MSLSVVDAVADTPAACESFHVPFQSGSDEVLDAMGRGHTVEKYKTIVDRIRTVRYLSFPISTETADEIVHGTGRHDRGCQRHPSRQM